MEKKYKAIYTQQLDESDCGVACLAMILKSYGSNLALVHLRELAKTDTEGTTALGLVKTAEKLNFKVTPVQADMSIFEMKDIKYPFIVHVIKNKDLLHYYVVLGKDNENIIIADPDPEVGIIKMPKDKFNQEWTGVTLLMKPGSNFKPIVENENSFISLFKYIFKQKKLVLKIIFASLIVTLISIASSYFLQGLIDTYIPKREINFLYIISLGLLIAYVFNSFSSYVEQVLLNILGQKLSIDINLKFIEHVLNLPMNFFATRKVGEITSRFGDASKVIEALANTTLTLCLDLGIVVIIGIVLAFQNFTLFLITLVALPLYGIVILGFTKKFEKLNNSQMESSAIVSSSIIEDLNGIETIKALSGENEQYHKIKLQFKKYLSDTLKYTKAESLQSALKTFIQLSLNVIILLVGSMIVIKGELKVGELITFNALLAYFLEPLQSIINLQPQLQTARVAHKRLNEIYLVDNEFAQERKNKNLEITKSTAEISLQNVSYSYNYGKDILKNINLEIEKNKKVALLGKSGSGKSTLVKLLVNFYDPTAGTIYLAGVDTQTIDKHVLRKNIVYVPQNPHIFAGSIKENILLGAKENVCEKEIIEACKIAEIYEDIKKLPLGFETLIDENGKTLSGGQKQRLTIARALLTGATVLIFDEVTSGLDTITENKVINNLTKLNRTIIFVAHRLAIAEMADEIIVLDNGMIEEQGTHTKLMKENRLYRRMQSNKGDN